MKWTEKEQKFDKNKVKITYNQYIEFYLLIKCILKEKNTTNLSKLNKINYWIKNIGEI